MASLEFNLSPTQAEFVDSDAVVRVIIGSFGEGKCHARGERILMFDGSVKNAEDVAVGDLLMGPDSKPRRVLALHRGLDHMLRVVPRRGDSFVVAGGHPLSLKRTNAENVKRGKPYRNSKVGDIVTVSVYEYMRSSASFRMYHKPYRVPVHFPTRKIHLDPYFLGLWLGDGTARDTGVTTADPEIKDYLFRFAKKSGVSVTVSFQKNNKSNVYSLTNGNCGGKVNPILNALRDCGVLSNKHIPLEYKANSRNIRLQLLAGLADSDGYRNRNSYQFIFKSKRLADDVAYLCRSLGFGVHMTPTTKRIKAINFKGKYYRIGVSGDLSGVPCLLKRKKCAPRKQIKDVLVSGIKEVVGISNKRQRFYGFEVDGDHRYLLADFTVTHNTWAAQAATLRHAGLYGPVKIAVIRDTLENIKVSVVQSMLEAFGNKVRFFDSYKQFEIKSDPKIEGYNLGINDPAAMSRLQGMVGVSIMWLEEPSPIIYKANAGLAEDVYKFALARSTRGNAPPLVMVTMNPGDEEHWTYTRLVAEDIVVAAEDRFPLFTKEVFFIPKGENPKLTELQRQINAAALAGDPELTQRYVEGEFSFLQPGIAVTPEYKEKRHRSEIVLPVVKGLPGFRFYDAWHHPAILLGQIYPNGRLFFLDSLYGENIGIRQLIEHSCLPLLHSPKWRDKVNEWRDIGDRSMMTPDQSNTNQSAHKVVEELLDARFEPGPERWLIRKMAAKQALTHSPDGEPAVVVCKANPLLHKTLKGGWHYPKDNMGNAKSDKPPKNNKYTNLGDAFSYGVGVLLPVVMRKEFKKPASQLKPRRAASYATGAPPPTMTIKKRPRVYV